MVHLLYFSGTGNSLHITKELLKCIPNSRATPIIQLLNKSESVIEGDAIGFIFPIYAFSIPNVLKELLMTKSFQPANYFFAVSSRHCSQRVFRLMNRLLAKQDKQLNAGFSVQAPENYIPTFDMPGQEDIDAFDNELQDKLGEIKEIVENRKKFRDKDSFLLSLFSNTLFPFMTFLHNTFNYFNFYNTFYADENCNSCGQCKEVCLSDRIEIIDGKPTWNKSINCYYCLACLPFCPKQAIQMKIGNTKKRKDIIIRVYQ